MVQSIQYRKRSFLGSDEWLTRPWDPIGKDILQTIYDKGFALAALFEEMDSKGILAGADRRVTVLAEYMRRCINLDADFNAWYEELLLQSPSPLFWSTPDSGYYHGDEAAPGSKYAPFTFPSFRLANACVTYWGLKTVLSGTIALLCGTIFSHSGPNQNELTQQYHDLQNTAERQITQYSSPHRLELAVNIMRSMPYCLNDSMGLAGSQKSLFGLRVALFTLRRQPGEELKWCQALYQELENKGGLRYAREIAKLDGKYSHSVTTENLPSRLAKGHGDE